ncbi:MAG: type IV pilus twitching motility protein PilT [Bdellovibrionales bacterium]|nr:type IV pilus twitching motility protein PilT [Bdellovibrionales bacterium]
MTIELDELLKIAVEKGASDVHLKAGIVPVMRRHGKLRPIAQSLPTLTGELIEKLVQNLMSERQYEDYKIKKEMDLGYGIRGLGRFRINVFRQRGTSRIVIRNIPHVVPQLKDLFLPPVVQKIANYERGLVLLTGATGSGKSTTIAAIIDYINRHKNRHILTIEDPIEFLIRDRKSIITQRELGVDAIDFPTALRSSLRQDPDIIFIGEMRDRNTIETALTAAETGHLVLSTLHTLDTHESVNRILSVFSETQQSQVRLQLGSVLRAIMCQRLATRIDGSGFVPAVEVMINNARVREMIENPGRTKEIPKAIEEGKVTFGMQSFDQSLFELVSNELISYEEALRLTDNNEDFAVRFGGINQFDENERDRWRNNIKYQKKVSNAWDELSEVELEESGSSPPPPPKKTRKS